MEYTASILKRSARVKKTNRIDSYGQPKTVKIKGGWFYRIRYVDAFGMPLTVERGPFDLKSHARDARDLKLSELKRSLGNIKTGERMTFNELADICEPEFYKPAVMSGKHKVSGVKSYDSSKAIIKNLRSFFGKLRINAITKQAAARYKEHRIKQPLQTAKTDEAKKKRVSIATVNRELTIFRRMMRHAHAEGWLLKDIFFNAKVISRKDEEARTRVLSRDEEARLLAACQGERVVTYERTRKSGNVENITATFSTDNTFLKAIIFIAIDSGLRRKEILKLRWDDLDLVNDVISVDAANTKTEMPRIAPLSLRAKEEIESLRSLGDGSRLFPVTWISRSFRTAARLAGIDDLQFRDLRRTFVSRRANAGGNALLVGKMSGHTELNTTLKHYTVLGVEDLRPVNDQINAENRLAVQTIESEAVN